MSFLQSLFSGAKALIRGVVEGVREVVRVVLTEIDNSSVGRANDTKKEVMRRYTER